MYAKNLPTPPKFNFPYQEQQRYSGSSVLKVNEKGTEKLSDETIRSIEASAKKLQVATE